MKPRSLIAIMGVAVAAVATVTDFSVAQSPDSPSASRLENEHAEVATSIVGRNSASVMSGLASLNERFQTSVVQIRDQHGAETLGTLVSDTGLVVAKNSAFRGKLTCIFASQAEHDAKVVAVDLRHDLAVIETKPNLGQPINFSNKAAAAVSPGTLVVSIGAQSPLGLGNVIVKPQTFSIDPPPCRDCIDLGITSVASSDASLKVLRIQSHTLAERIGILAKDKIVRINGRPISDLATLQQTTAELRVGHTLKIDIVRNQKPMTLTRKIEQLAGRSIHDQWGGGPFSQRRFDLGQVIAHDTTIDPQACGGPLVDLQGNLIGINMARSLRIATFAIPASTIRQIVNGLRAGSID